MYSLNLYSSLICWAQNKPMRTCLMTSRTSSHGAMTKIKPTKSMSLWWTTMQRWMLVQAQFQGRHPSSGANQMYDWVPCCSWVKMFNSGQPLWDLTWIRQTGRHNNLDLWPPKHVIPCCVASQENLLPPTTELLGLQILPSWNAEWNGRAKRAEKCSTQRLLQRQKGWLVLSVVKTIKTTN